MSLPVVDGGLCVGGVVPVSNGDMVTGGCGDDGTDDWWWWWCCGGVGGSTRNCMVVMVMVGGTGDDSPLRSPSDDGDADRWIVTGDALTANDRGFTNVGCDCDGDTAVLLVLLFEPLPPFCCLLPMMRRRAVGGDCVGDALIDDEPLRGVVDDNVDLGCNSAAGMAPRADPRGSSGELSSVGQRPVAANEVTPVGILRSGVLGERGRIVATAFTGDRGVAV